MEPTESDIERIGANIWSAALGLELSPKQDGAMHDPNERVVMGMVQITGEWEGAVSVQVSERLASSVAAHMFAMSIDEVTEERLNDAVGELANLTSSDIKMLLEGTLALSLPSVTAGKDYTVSMPDTVQRAVSMDVDGELVVITVLKRRT